MICAGVKLLRGMFDCPLPGLNSVFQPGLETTGHVILDGTDIEGHRPKWEKKAATLYVAAFLSRSHQDVVSI